MARIPINATASWYMDLFYAAWVLNLHTVGGQTVDFIKFLRGLHDHVPHLSNGALSIDNALLTALDELENRRGRFTAVTVSLVWAASAQPIASVTIPLCDPWKRICALETLGYTLFRCLETGGRWNQSDTDAYGQWIARDPGYKGGRPIHTNEPWRRGTTAAPPDWVVERLFRFAESYRTVYTAVGLYWLIPLLYAGHVPPHRYGEFQVDTEVRSTTTHGTSSDGTAPSAPDVVTLKQEISHFDLGELTRAQAVLFGVTMRFQCTMTPDDTSRFADGDGLLLMGTDVLVLTVGGVPVATMAYETQNSGTPGAVTLIQSLCATMHSACARALVEYHRENAAIVVRLSNTNRAFYAALGFTERGQYMVWLQKNNAEASMMANADVLQRMYERSLRAERVLRRVDADILSPCGATAM